MRGSDGDRGADRVPGVDDPRGMGPRGRPPARPITPEAFEAAFDQHRRELHVHCYRMTGSFTDAEDLTQETFLRAWRNLDHFEQRSSVRTWLYRIATNAALDLLKRHEHRMTPVGTFSDPLEDDPRIQPYPDHLIAQGADPADVSARRATTSLVFVDALTRLPPRQRAALIASDVLEYSAAETAALLDTTEPAANSLLQRARATMRRHAPDLEDRAMPADDEAVLRRYVDAHERGDADAIVAMLHDDIRITMPPEPPCIGRADATRFLHHILGPRRPGDWMLVPTRANGRPATANYLRRPGDTSYRALSLDVLQTRGPQLATISCFLGDQLFTAFGLPLTRP